MLQYRAERSSVVLQSMECRPHGDG